MVKVPGTTELYTLKWNIPYLEEWWPHWQEYEFWKICICHCKHSIMPILYILCWWCFVIFWHYIMRCITARRSALLSKPRFPVLVIGNGFVIRACLGCGQLREMGWHVSSRFLLESTARKVNLSGFWHPWGGWLDENLKNPGIFSPLAGVWTQGLTPAGQSLYHWAASPVLFAFKFYFEACSCAGLAIFLPQPLQSEWLRL